MVTIGSGFVALGPDSSKHLPSPAGLVACATGGGGVREQRFDGIGYESAWTLPVPALEELNRQVKASLDAQPVDAVLSRGGRRTRWRVAEAVRRVFDVHRAALASDLSDELDGRSLVLRAVLEEAEEQVLRAQVRRLQTQAVAACAFAEHGDFYQEAVERGELPG